MDSLGEPELARGRAATNLNATFPVFLADPYARAEPTTEKDDLIHGSDHNSAKCVPVKWAMGDVAMCSMARASASLTGRLGIIYNLNR
jgi:hypothetical protein